VQNLEAAAVSIDPDEERGVLETEIAIDGERAFEPGRDGSLNREARCVGVFPEPVVEPRVSGTKGASE
jgi:hypothetical protein